MSNPNCTVCRHDRQADIDAALRAGMAQAAVGRMFGVPRGSVQRHAQNHLPRTPVPTAPAEPDERGAAEQLREQIATLQVIESTTTSTTGRVAVHREMRLARESLGRLEGPPRPAEADPWRDDRILWFMAWLLEAVERHDALHRHDRADSLRVGILEHAAEGMAAAEGRGTAEPDGEVGSAA